MRICMLDASVAVFQRPQGLPCVCHGLSLPNSSASIFLVFKENNMGTNNIVFSVCSERLFVGGFDVCPEK